VTVEASAAARHPQERQPPSSLSSSSPGHPTPQHEHSKHNESKTQQHNQNTTIVSTVTQRHETGAASVEAGIVNQEKPSPPLDSPALSSGPDILPGVDPPVGQRTVIGNPQEAGARMARHREIDDTGGPARRANRRHTSQGIWHISLQHKHKP